MEQNGEPTKDPHKYAQMIFDEDEKNDSMKQRQPFQEMVTKTTIQPQAKKEPWPNSHLIKKIKKGHGLKC